MDARVLGAVSLGALFHPRVEDTLRDLDLHDPAVADYLAGVLTRFSRVEELWALGATGARLERVADYLEALRGGPGRAAEAGARLRLVQQLGDYLLFMTGFFWERAQSAGARRHWIRTGREAYRTAGEHAGSPCTRQVLRRLGDGFDRYAGALSYLREVYLEGEFSPAAQMPWARLITWG
jgi:hypothetical protein